MSGQSSTFINLGPPLPSPSTLSTSGCCCGMLWTCRRDGRGWDGHHEDGGVDGGDPVPGAQED